MGTPPGNKMWVPDPLAAITQSGPSPQPRSSDPIGRRGDERLATTRSNHQLWNPRRVAGRIPVGISIDTGARGRKLRVTGVLERCAALGGQCRVTDT